MSYDVNQTDNLGKLSDPTYLYSVEKVRAAVSCVYSIMICSHQKVKHCGEIELYPSLLFSRTCSSDYQFTDSLHENNPWFCNFEMDL